MTRKQRANQLASRRATLYRMSAKRHAGHVPCFVCGDHVERPDASLEHVIPVSRGGSDELSNLAISHEECNQQRGNPRREGR